MSKYMHPSVTGRALVEREPDWPPVPWTCPSCGATFAAHGITVGTIYPDGRQEFFCVPCDFVHYQEETPS